MSLHTISLIKNGLNEKGKDISKSSVLVLGLAYRSGVKEIRKSPGVKIAKELKMFAKNVFAYDPLFTEKEIKSMGFSYKENFADIDCIVVTTKEKKFVDLNWTTVANEVSTKVIVDTQNIISYEKLHGLGFSIRRIGYAK